MAEWLLPGGQNDILSLAASRAGLHSMF